MRLAFSTNAYTRFPLIEALRGIRKAGFDGVEILADVPHAYPEAIDAALITDIRGELSRLGLSVSNVNANCSFGYWKDAPPEPYFEPSLISPNPQHRHDRAQLIRTALRFAREIGAGNISITSGRMLGGMPPDRARAQFAASILPILDEADRLNVNVGIECEPGLFIEYVTELREWIDQMQHPRLGANLDIGHSQVIGESIPDAVALLGRHIWNCHVEDIPGRKHYHMIPGEGSLDWSALPAALERIRYDRFLTVELYTHTADPQAAAEKSFRFLSERFSWTMPTITLYTKPGCHLCEAVEQTIRAVQREHPFELDVRNILDDPDDLRRYGELIPIVLLEGREIARYRLSAAQLVDALARSAGS